MKTESTDLKDLSTEDLLMARTIRDQLATYGLTDDRIDALVKDEKVRQYIADKINNHRDYYNGLIMMMAQQFRSVSTNPVKADNLEELVGIVDVMSNMLASLMRYVRETSYRITTEDISNLMAMSDTSLTSN